MEVQKQLTQLQELIGAVIEMRKLQKEFFKNHDRQVLDQSKLQERNVDKLLNELLEIPTPSAAQPSLFTSNDPL